MIILLKDFDFELADNNVHHFKINKKRESIAFKGSTSYQYHVCSYVCISSEHGNGISNLSIFLIWQVVYRLYLYNYFTRSISILKRKLYM